MTNQEILEKAIQIAVNNGFNPGPSENGEAQIRTFTRRMMQDLFFRKALIFNHDFAKALWGDEGFTTTGLKCDKHPGVRRYWQYHLQQMVIADDPIKYLEKNAL